MSNYHYTKEATDNLMEVWKVTLKELGGELVSCNSSIDPNLVTLLGKLNETMKSTVDAAMQQAETLDSLEEKMQKVDYMLSEMLAAQGRAEKALDCLTEAVNKK